MHEEKWFWSRREAETFAAEQRSKPYIRGVRLGYSFFSTSDPNWYVRWW